MISYEELFAIAARLDSFRDPPELAEAEQALCDLDNVVSEASRAFSGSWLGYHAYVYYENLAHPPPGAHFSQEWGLQDMPFTSMGTRGDWHEYDPRELEAALRSRAGDPDLDAVTKVSTVVGEAFNAAKSEIRSILLTENTDQGNVYISELLGELDKLRLLTPHQILHIWSPKGRKMTRDAIVVGQGTKIPPHQAIKAQVESIRRPFSLCQEAALISRKAASHLERQLKRNVREGRIGTDIFIGHGRSPLWRELKDFVQDRLHLPWDEFNRVPVAGMTNQARLREMLDSAAVALLILTAEDETAEGQIQARMNVIHEVGLFQGRLGFTKAIVLVEEGCQEFTNIQGIGQIRFPPDNISASFEEIRRVLEREGVVKTSEG